MATLKRGSTGPEVKKLQKRLKKAGFDPGLIDGEFGGGTEAAVMAFQASKGLLPDGKVGPRTLAALGKSMSSVQPDPPLPDDAVTVERVSLMFHDAPIQNIRKHLPTVIQALKDADLYDKPMVLMALATIRAETAGFVPISEFKSRFNTSPNGHPFDLYDNRRDLGNRGRPDGDLFKGRGFVQLTGRSNYKSIGRKIGLGDRLVNDPELANDPEIAAQILAAFLKRQEIPIKQDLIADDLRSARRRVNGGSHGLQPFKEAYRIGQRVIPDIG